VEEVIGSLAVAVAAVSFLLELVEEDREVLMLEEEMGAELHHHLQSQKVVMLWQIPVEVVAEQAMHLLLMVPTQVLVVPVSFLSLTQPDKYLKT
tara:strand:+ start:1538 stop:1819 length:282 start_codon:yes stop_codon:yes gene_type:complete